MLRAAHLADVVSDVPSPLALRAQSTFCPACLRLRMRVAAAAAEERAVGLGRWACPAADSAALLPSSSCELLRRVTSGNETAWDAGTAGFFSGGAVCIDVPARTAGLLRARGTASPASIDTERASSGPGTDADECPIVLWHILPKLAVRRIASGTAHIIACGVDGAVYGAGWNAHGQVLGFETTEPVRRLALISGGANEAMGDVCSISCGHAHSVALLSDARLIAWGSNEYGQCGGDSLQLRLVESVHETQCMGFIDLHGKVFSAGSVTRARNQLVELSEATRAAGFSQEPPGVQRNGRSIAAIACGWMHTLLLCSDGSVYACGDNRFGQCGRERSVGKRTTTAGEAMRRAETADCLGTSSAFSALQRVLLNEVCVSISAGAFHSVFVTALGDGFACGWNSSGQCGGAFAGTAISRPVLLEPPVAGFASSPASSEPERALKASRRCALPECIVDLRAASRATIVFGSKGEALLVGSYGIDELELRAARSRPGLRLPQSSSRSYDLLMDGDGAVLVQYPSKTKDGDEEQKRPRLTVADE